MRAAYPFELRRAPDGPLSTFVLAVADTRRSRRQRIVRVPRVEDELDHLPVAFVQVVPVVVGVEQPVLKRELLGMHPIAFLRGWSFRPTRSPAIPRPRAVDLHLQREAEQDPNQNNDAEHGHALERRVYDDGANDVRHDEHFEAKQDASTEIATKPIVRPLLLRSVGRIAEKCDEKDQATDHHDPGTDRLDALYEVGDDLLVAHGGEATPASWRRR